VILVDTNVLVAAARTADTHHVAAARLLRETEDRFLVAPTVLAKTCYLLHEFGGPAPEVAFLRSIAAGELELAVLTVAAERVKAVETVGVYALCMRASLLGWLIQAAVGSFGGSGRR